MKKNLYFCFVICLTGLVMFFSGCAEKLNPQFPPVDGVFTVSDMYLMDDGKHLIVLNSNFNRLYDYGSVTIWDISTPTAPSVTAAILIQSLAGKMAIAPLEMNPPAHLLFVTSREYDRLHTLYITNPDSDNPGLAYFAPNAADPIEASSVPVPIEPYALMYDPLTNRLLVTHVRIGDIGIYDVNPMLTDLSSGLIGDYMAETAVTDIVYDPFFDIYLLTHKFVYYLSAVQVNGAGHDIAVSDQYLDIDLPYDGTDMRSISPGREASTYYISYRNTDEEQIVNPTLVKISLEGTRDRLFARTLWTSQIRGLNGEAVAVSFPGELYEELVFVSSYSDQRVFAVDGKTGTLVYEIDLEDFPFTVGSTTTTYNCHPYELHARPDISRTLFVSCFQDNLVLAIDIEPGSETLFTVKGVLGEN